MQHAAAHRNAQLFPSSPPPCSACASNTARALVPLYRPPVSAAPHAPARQVREMLARMAPAGPHVLRGDPPPRAHAHARHARTRPLLRIG